MTGVEIFVIGVIGALTGLFLFMLGWFTGKHYVEEHVRMQVEALRFVGSLEAATNGGHTTWRAVDDCLDMMPGMPNFDPHEHLRNRS